MKSNDTMKNLFNWKKINLETFVCDEDYINENKDKFKYCHQLNYFQLKNIIILIIIISFILIILIKEAAMIKLLQ